MGFATLKDLTPQQSYRLATFRAATRGVERARLERVLFAMQPHRTAVDFFGCTKVEMLDAWVRGDLKDYQGQHLRLAINRTL